MYKPLFDAGASMANAQKSFYQTRANSGNVRPGWRVIVLSCKLRIAVANYPKDPLDNWLRQTLVENKLWSIAKPYYFIFLKKGLQTSLYGLFKIRSIRLTGLLNPIFC